MTPLDHALVQAWLNAAPEPVRAWARRLRARVLRAEAHAQQLAGERAVLAEARRIQAQQLEEARGMEAALRQQVSALVRECLTTGRVVATADAAVSEAATQPIG